MSESVDEMTEQTSKTSLDSIDHIAIAVEDVEAAVAWYKNNFRCSIDYQDKTWAFISFDNIKLALVVPNQHPPHIALVCPNAESFGNLKTHRDGTRSCYIKDPAGNSVEVMASESL
jgi:catechol 2,3-dioxygenase-like lactoylglutathione lyase family enzyme